MNVTLLFQINIINNNNTLKTFEVPTKIIENTTKQVNV